MSALVVRRCLLSKTRKRGSRASVRNVRRNSSSPNRPAGVVRARFRRFRRSASQTRTPRLRLTPAHGVRRSFPLRSATSAAMSNVRRVKRCLRPVNPACAHPLHRQSRAEKAVLKQKAQRVRRRANSTMTMMTTAPGNANAMMTIGQATRSRKVDRVAMMTTMTRTIVHAKHDAQTVAVAHKARSSSNGLVSYRLGR